MADPADPAIAGAPVVVVREVAGAPFGELTPRQREVAEALASGRSNKEIAARLGLSVATVKDHVHAVLSRLGLSRRAEVAALARRGPA